MERTSPEYHEKHHETCQAAAPESTGRWRHAPPDGGWGWMALLGAFFSYLIADGWSYTFGVFFPIFLQDFQESRSKTAIIGAMIYGVPRLVAPVVCMVITSYGSRRVAIVGGLLTSVAFIASSFATSVNFLCFSLGALASVGFATCYITSIVTVTFYFEKRRGFATGLATTGSGLGAFLFPLLLEFLLNKYSWRGSLLLLGAITLHIVVAGALFRKPPLTYVTQNVHGDDDEDQALKSCEVTFSSSIDVTGQMNDNSSHVPRDTHNLHLPSIISISSWSLALSSRDNHNDKVDNCDLKALNQDHRPHITIKTTPERPKPNQVAAEACADVDALGDDQTEHEDKEDTPMRSQAADSDAAHEKLEEHPQLSSNFCQCSKVRGGFCNTKSRLKKLLLRTKELHKASWLINHKFLIFCASSFIFYVFVVFPYLYLVDHAMLTGHSKRQSAMLLSIIGISRTAGQIILGWLGDLPKTNSIYLYSFSIAGTGIATAIIPLCTTYSALCFACSLFGFAVSATYVLQMMCVIRMVGLEKATNAFGFFQLIPGIATLAGTPMAGLMYEAYGVYDPSFYVAGALIFFSGCVLLPIPLLCHATKSTLHQPDDPAAESDYVNQKMHL